MCGSSEDLLELELSVDDSIECFLCDDSFEDIMFSFSPRNKIQGDKGLNVPKCDCKLYWQTKQFNPESDAVYLKHTVWMVAELEMKNAELKNLALDVEDEREAAVSIYNKFQ